MSALTSVHSKILYYVDYNGAVWRDVESGPCPRLIRMIKSLWRDYNIFHVEAALKQAPPSLEKDYVCSVVAKKCGITSDQYRSLVSMTKLFSNDRRQLQSLIDQRVDFTSFLKDIQGNKKFNQSVKTLMGKARDLGTISHNVLEEVSAFSHKTTMKDEIVRVATKADTVLENYLSDSIIFRNPNRLTADDTMLTLKEVKTLESAAKMKSFLDRIAQHANVEDPSIDALYKAVANSNQFIETTLSLAEKQDPSKPGTFIAYDLETDYRLRGQAPSWITTFIFKTLFKTNIRHISVGLRDDNGQDLEAHMLGSPISKYKLCRRSLGNRCFKTIRLNPQLLIDERKMKMLYGDDRLNILDERYESISRPYFKTNPELKKLDEIKKKWALLGLSEEAPKFNPPIRENRRLNRVIPHEIVRRSLNEGLATVIPQAVCIRAMIQCNEEDLMF